MTCGLCPTAVDLYEQSCGDLTCDLCPTAVDLYEQSCGDLTVTSVRQLRTCMTFPELSADGRRERVWRALFRWLRTAETKPSIQTAALALLRIFTSVAVLGLRDKVDHHVCTNI